MREISVDLIKNQIKEMFIDMNYNIGEDVENALKSAEGNEESPIGKAILGDLLKNIEIARHDHIPICQDCGSAVVFIDIGQEVSITGGDLNDAIEDAVRSAYGEGFLRKSMCHPFTRKNTQDNTPAIIHARIVSGDKIHIIAGAKGGGSENMSIVKMMKPADGYNGIKDFVLKHVNQAGANPCPPIVVGIGIGGSFEMSAINAKRALLRNIGEHNPDKEIADMETDLLKNINCLGIGPEGLGGKTTALAVNIEMMPCHIASLPVAININCHATRHRETTL